MSIEYLTEKDGDKMRKAIETLCQEPCEDAISRQAVLDALDKSKYSNEFCKEHYIDQSINLGMAHIVVNELEPVVQQPKTGHWIPVSERLPKEEGSYMTTLDYGEYGLSVGQRFYYGKDYGWTDGHVIAWMPLPKDFSVERTRRF